MRVRPHVFLGRIIERDNVEGKTGGQPNDLQVGRPPEELIGEKTRFPRIEKRKSIYR